MCVHAPKLICSTGVSSFQTFKRVFCMYSELRFRPTLLPAAMEYILSWPTYSQSLGPILPYLSVVVFIWLCVLVDLVRIYRDYFMESACVRDFHTSWWSIWYRTSERSERVSFLIQNQRVWKSRTKRFPCSNLFISYILRFLLFIQLQLACERRRISACHWFRRK